MNKTILYIAGVVILGVILVAAYVLRPPAEAGAPIEAIPLATGETGDPLPTEAPSAQEPPAQPTAASNTAGLPAGVVVFQIVQDESEVRFSVDEELRGSPATAVGTTDQIAGEIGLDFENPANSQVGMITVNARTFSTDNNFRNRALRNEILDTGAFEFITFTPTQITGLPETITTGETVSFQITGDLTIRDITQPATFEVTATLVAADRLEGAAVSTVQREDFSLVIPSVPNVANVSEEVLLEFEFVAAPK